MPKYSWDARTTFKTGLPYANDLPLELPATSQQIPDLKRQEHSHKTIQIADRSRGGKAQVLQSGYVASLHIASFGQTLQFPQSFQCRSDLQTTTTVLTISSELCAKKVHNAVDY